LHFQAAVWWSAYYAFAQWSQWNAYLIEDVRGMLYKDRWVKLDEPTRKVEAVAIPISGG